MRLRPATSTLFPYTTLFRSLQVIVLLNLSHILLLYALDKLFSALFDVHFLVVHRLHLPLLTRNGRSEEHTCELQSRGQLVCRLLLGKHDTTTAALYTSMTSA